MRKVKCRNCESKTPQNEAYLIVHVTSGGNEQNRYYCSEECYRKEQSEIFMLKQCQYFIDELLGYVCVNNQKNKSLKELIDAGYTREQVYDCMLEMKDKIIESLAFRGDIENEGHKILYIYSIIRNNIKEITDRNIKKNAIKTENNDYVEIIEDSYIEAKVNKSKSNNKKTLMDIIRGGSNE